MMNRILKRAQDGGRGSFFCGLIVIVVIAAAGCGSTQASPLDEYVAAPDPAYGYDTPPAKVVEDPAFTASVYKMRSQNWLTEDKVDRTLWEHWVVIAVPKEMRHDTAMVFIAGGSNTRPEPPDIDVTLAQIAVATQSIMVVLRQIPNQPLHFPDEHDSRYKEKGRVEDEMIAYAWDKFMATQDPLWLPRLPMTKAAVRTMDMVQDLHPEVKRFVVAGGSKRGWTTWTTGVVDKRVAGIVPAVIDVLNVEPSMQHHFDAYGYWAPAVSEYQDEKIFDRLHTDEFRALLRVVDPYSYVDRLTMPKYIVNGTGDQFFLPDSSQFYFDDLVGDKYLRYVPNTDHGLNQEAYFNLASFYATILNNQPRPKFTWEHESNGTLRVRCETRPETVLLWQATNPDARNFRLDSIGPAYTSTPVEPDADGHYTARVAAPEKGWTAYFMELTYPNPSFPSPFKATTSVYVTPDTLPFKDANIVRP